MTNSIRTSLALSGLVLATACSGTGDAGPTWSGTMRDSAGVTIVENQDVPLWGEGDGWTFTRLVRVGVREGDDRYQMGGVSGLVVLSDGRIVIADAMARNVRFFTPDGEHLVTVGRRGSGPGEFAGVIQLFVGPGDTILAVDRRALRANRIAPDGTWLGSTSAAPEGGFFIYGLDDDQITHQIVALIRPLGGDAAPSDVRFAYVVSYDLYGTIGDTLARLPNRQSRSPSGETELRHYYRGGPDYDLCDGMLVTSHSDDFRFVWNRPDGSIERIATLDRERLPITAEDRDLLYKEVDADFKADGRSAGQAGEFKSRMRFEDQYPAWRRFVCGPRGSILVQRVRTVSETYPDVNLSERPIGGDWDTYDRQGRYLGVPSLPTYAHRHAFVQLQSGEWVMLGIEEDEMDVQYVSVWRVDGLEDGTGGTER